jgi:hypothetical protein
MALMIRGTRAEFVTFKDAECAESSLLFVTILLDPFEISSANSRLLQGGFSGLSADYAD